MLQLRARRCRAAPRERCAAGTHAAPVRSSGGPRPARRSPAAPTEAAGVEVSGALTARGDAPARRVLDPACEHQTTCRIHNDLAISSDSWAVAPSGWVGTVDSYRTELVNHVVGQWLGFDHPNCSALASQTPVLSAPSVTIPGCSPKWYAVPPELQDAKVLAGF